MTEAPASALNDICLHEQIIALGSGPDRPRYPIDKLQAHIDNVPHLAISIFVFKDEQLLLQQRAATKYHSAGLWANTVCSHPRWQESAQQCAERRLQEELGWSSEVYEFGQIDYAAKVGELFENERVHCFAGSFDTSNNINHFNRKEVAAVEWLEIPEILQQIEQKPEIFTEWFKIYMSQHHQLITEQLSS